MKCHDCGEDREGPFVCLRCFEEVSHPRISEVFDANDRYTLYEALRIAANASAEGTFGIECLKLRERMLRNIASTG